MAAFRFSAMRRRRRREIRFFISLSLFHQTLELAETSPVAIVGRGVPKMFTREFPF